MISNFQNLVRQQTSTMWGFCSLLLCFASCGDSEKDAYIEATSIDKDVVMTHVLADSLWAVSLSAPYVEATEAIPSDPNDPYFEDYATNWLEKGEEFRDVVITYSGETATISYEDDSKKTKKLVQITCRGAHVTIHNDTIIDGIAEGRSRMNYILRGQTDNGSLRVYSNKKFMVTLDGVSLTNAEGAAINVQKAPINDQKELDKKRMIINLAEGTDNYLTDAEIYTDTIAGEDEKACLFSEGKMIFMGNGNLTVTGRRSHAIAADDRIHVHTGVHLTVNEAAKDGIHAKDEIVLSGGLLQIFAQKDAVQSSDTLSDGLMLRGARLLACGKRAVTAGKFTATAGSFCLIGNATDLPTDGTPYTLLTPKGYVIAIKE